MTGRRLSAEMRSRSRARTPKRLDLDDRAATRPGSKRSRRLGPRRLEPAVRRGRRNGIRCSPRSATGSRGPRSSARAPRGDRSARGTRCSCFEVGRRPGRNHVADALASLGYAGRHDHSRPDRPRREGSRVVEGRRMSRDLPNRGRLRTRGQAGRPAVRHGLRARRRSGEPSTAGAARSTRLKGRSAERDRARSSHATVEPACLEVHPGAQRARRRALLRGCCCRAADA